MQDQQNNRERLLDRLERKDISVDEANVEMVRQARFRVVHKLPASVRKALNAAVKNGQLGHMKKDGVKPEIYYHPTFEYLAVAERNEYVRAAERALKAICK